MQTCVFLQRGEIGVAINRSWGFGLRGMYGVTLEEAVDR